MKKFLAQLSAKNRYILMSLAFLAIVAIILTWFLEFRFFINDFAKTSEFVFGSFHVFLFNSFVLWLLLLIIWTICGRPILTSAIAFTIISIIGYIHVAKFNSRGTPLLPEDFQLASEAATLTKFVNIWSIVWLIVSIIVVCILLFLLSHFFGKKFYLRYVNDDKKVNVFWRHLAIERSSIFVVAIILFLCTTNFARHHSGLRYEDTFLGTQFTAWNQNDNYRDNGFIIGFLYNMQKLSMDEPEGYDEQSITATRKSYEEIAKTKNAEKKSPKDENVNVIIILNESFYDPDVEFNGKKFSDYYQVSGEVLPEYHKIQKQAQSGWMYSLDYGGGTANIEFEALTGMTNFWTNTVPYTAFIPKAGNVPSIANTLKADGYKTTAIHPFNGGMYKRNIAIKNEGFDTFITESDMDFNEHDGKSEYINDQSAYQQVIKTLNESDYNQLIGLITMQNHTPYNWDIYENHDFSVSSTSDVSEDRLKEISSYLQSVHESDKYLGEFIDNLSQLDKKVVVLFFGDHTAGVFETIAGSDDKATRDISRITPYFIWTNYDAGLNSENSLPTTTPNCMVNTMLDRLNWQKAPYYYLVGDVCNEQPILATAYLDGLDFDFSETMKNYQLFTYDILGGKKYWMAN